MIKLIENSWYTDTSTGNRWKLIKVHEFTVEAVSEDGTRATHNGMMWEHPDMSKEE